MIALFIVSFFFDFVAFWTGVVGCWRRGAGNITSTAILMLLACKSILVSFNFFSSTRFQCECIMPPLSFVFINTDRINQTSGQKFGQFNRLLPLGKLIPCLKKLLASVLLFKGVPWRRWPSFSWSWESPSSLTLLVLWRYGESTVSVPPTAGDGRLVCHRPLIYTCVLLRFVQRRWDGSLARRRILRKRKIGWWEGIPPPQGTPFYSICAFPFFESFSRCSI